MIGGEDEECFGRFELLELAEALVVLFPINASIVDIRLCMLFGRFVVVLMFVAVVSFVVADGRLHVDSLPNDANGSSFQSCSSSSSRVTAVYFRFVCLISVS